MTDLEPKESKHKRILKRYDYLKQCWKDSRDQADIDDRYNAGDPWSKDDRKAREGAQRPCLSHDELKQYVNQAINQLRMNPRGIQVDPDGKGADKKSAELIQDLIRTIEYKCGASSIYISAFEPAVRRGYGFFRITRKYSYDRYEPDKPELYYKLREQDIIVKPVLNPDSVLLDWDANEVDWSDAKDCFIVDWMLKDDFKRKYPGAEVKDFVSDDQGIYTDWFQRDKVMVAEYWEVESTFKTLYFYPGGMVSTKRVKGIEPEAERELEEKSLVQYIVSGAEILKKIPQPGTIIPIIIVPGEQVYEKGKRKLISLIRLARNPQMSLAYIVSQMMEEASLSPKSPYVGYRGQFESAREAWETCTKQPYAYLEADPVVDAAGTSVLPLPRQSQFTPNFVAYIGAIEMCRRAIQAAFGISPLPTAAQRDSEKSGVALEKIQQAQQTGSFHFNNNFDRALRLAGRVIDQWIPVVYDTDREMMLQKADGSNYRAMINPPKENGSYPYIDGIDQEHMVEITNESEHHITISAGPAKSSIEEEVKDLLQTFAGNMAALPPPGTPGARIMSLLIKSLNLGPRGDEIAKIFGGDQEEGQAQIPPEVQQQIEQMGQQLQALNEYAKQKEQELAELQKQIDGKVIDNEAKERIATAKNENDLAIASMKLEQDSVVKRLQIMEAFMEKIEGQRHEHDLLDHQAELQPAETTETGDSEAGEGEQQ